MIETNISVPRGDTIDLNGVVTNTDDEGVVTRKDISDPLIQLRFTAKYDRDTPDAEAEFRYGTANTTLSGITITDAVEGEYRVRIPAADQADITGDDLVVLYYDVQLFEPGPIITTIVKGRLALEPDTTRS